MNYRHPLVLTKFAISRVILVENYCKRCGRTAEPFFVPDDFWTTVVNEHPRNERCVRCFTAESVEEGHHVEWGLRPAFVPARFACRELAIGIGEKCRSVFRSAVKIVKQGNNHN